MHINKISLALVLFTAVSATPVLAKDITTNLTVEAKTEAKTGSQPGFLKSLFSRGKAAVGNGEVTAINGTTLTIDDEGTTYTVLTDSNTQFRRRFWGKGSLADIEVGHSINVIGHWSDETHTSIKAKHVRDISIQMRNGVFFGVVKEIVSSGWLMTTVKRGNQAVTVTSDTKFENRKEETIIQSDIKVGHKVRVRGLWDKEAGTITQVTEVKDFSLPVKETTPTPTPTP